MQLSTFDSDICSIEIQSDGRWRPKIDKGPPHAWIPVLPAGQNDKISSEGQGETTDEATSKGGVKLELTGSGVGQDETKLGSSENLALDMLSGGSGLGRNKRGREAFEGGAADSSLGLGYSADQFFDLVDLDSEPQAGTEVNNDADRTILVRLDHGGRNGESSGQQHPGSVPHKRPRTIRILGPRVSNGADGADTNNGTSNNHPGRTANNAPRQAGEETLRSRERSSQEDVADWLRQMDDGLLLSQELSGGNERGVNGRGDARQAGTAPPSAAAVASDAAAGTAGAPPGAASSPSATAAAALSNSAATRTSGSARGQMGKSGSSGGQFGQPGGGGSGGIGTQLARQKLITEVI